MTEVMHSTYSLQKVFSMKCPKFENKDYIGLNGTTESQLVHPHFEVWQKWLLEEYESPKNKLALFIPCAAIKPYYNSPIHKEINEKILEYENKIHKIVISNAGVIPYEFAGEYPFDSYDWNPLTESEEIAKRYYEITKDRIYQYLKNHEYNAYVSYLRPNSISFNSLKYACQDLGINLISCMLNESIDENKDSDLVLIYPNNLKLLKTMLEGQI